MRHDPRDLLTDMQRFINELEVAVGKRTQEQYEADFVIRRAVEREFILIAEVVRRLKAVSDEAHERVESIQQITGFRNVLVHDYDNVDDEIVWSSIKVALPRLKQQINAWAAELGVEPQPANVVVRSGIE